MTLGISKVRQFLKRFRKREDGGPTVEFVLLFMPIMVITMTGMELGLLMTRHVMLERGLDMAVREVRLNTATATTNAQFKRLVCNAAGLIPDCTNNLRLEMRPIDPRSATTETSNSIPRAASCTDRSDPFAPPRNFTNGAENEIMIVRACALFKPMLIGGMGLGVQLNQNTDGVYRLVSTTAFVMEPL